MKHAILLLLTTIGSSLFSMSEQSEQTVMFRNPTKLPIVVRYYKQDESGNPRQIFEEIPSGEHKNITLNPDAGIIVQSYVPRPQLTSAAHIVLSAYAIIQGEKKGSSKKH